MAQFKQKKAAREFIKNGGDLKAAVKAAGYSPSAVHNYNQAVGKSKGFQQELIKAGVTENELAKLLREGMQATKYTDFKGEVSDTGLPDHQIRHRYLETAIRVKGIIEAPTQVPGVQNIQVNINDSTPRGEAIVEDFTEYMKQQTLPKKVIDIKPRDQGEPAG